ncbi:MAG TPA: prepilin peptidase [Candidatus Dormibacteraeota bacterium]|nr:prepilin peptidase [Candidatus Dormibacteraeota bacterium]
MILHAQFLIAALWAVLGAAAGVGVRWGSVRLAILEGDLEPGHKWWQVYGPPVLSAIVFGIYGYEITSFPVLVVRSIFVLVLVQVIFFDFEYHLILDRVIFPSMILALALAVLGKPWWPGGTLSGNGLVLERPVADALIVGIGTGLLFLLLAFLGAAIFKAEALGFGDVKLVLFMGLLLGWPYTVTALFYGVVLASVGAITFIVVHRSLKGTIAYGPYLAAGALLVLLQLP